MSPSTPWWLPFRSLRLVSSKAFPVPWGWMPTMLLSSLAASRLFVETPTLGCPCCLAALVCHGWYFVLVHPGRGSDDVGRTTPSPLSSPFAYALHAVAHVSPPPALRGGCQQGQACYHSPLLLSLSASSLLARTLHPPPRISRPVASSSSRATIFPPLLPVPWLAIGADAPSPPALTGRLPAAAGALPPTPLPSPSAGVRLAPAGRPTALIG